MNQVRSFEPIARQDARILILGSMPGEASLVAGQYYAHGRNAFWPILGELLGFDATAPYAQRVAALKVAKVAVWDVLHSCRRVGSLDSSIEKETLVTNDFSSFLAGHRQITHLFFNGATAEECFRRRVLPQIDAGALQLTRLPSTSPANASFSFERKREAWRAILPALQS